MQIIFNEVLISQMKKKQPHIFPPYIIHGFFLVGLISAVAFRSIVIIQRFEPAWVRPVWYIGVLGYVGFFLYRYSVSKKRKMAIKDYGLMEKIEANTPLKEEDKEVLMYLLSSIKKSHEDINYLVIFILSVLAVMADIFLSFYA